MDNETPQTEREWRILFIGELKKISHSVDGLAKTVHDFRETEVTEMRKDIAKLQRFEAEVTSSYKTIVAISATIGALLAIIVRALV